MPILVKSETAETLQRFSELISTLGASLGPLGAPDVAPAAGPLEGQSSESAAPDGPALLAYVAELLEKGFPIPSIVAKGSRLELELIQPVSPGDTLILTGRVVDKREDQDRRLVECQITVENQAGEAVALAQATLCL